MQSAMKILLTAGLGAATMYYLDPTQGRERRDVARERLERGRDNLHDLSRTARAVSHDVGERTDRAFHGVRTVGHEVGGRAGRALHRARAVGHDLSHDIGHRTGRLAHGLREAGHDVRARAAGAASSLGSLVERGRPGLRGRKSGRSPLKLLGIPLKWLLVAGVGASAMYFLDPSQGIYRRARLRNRFLDNRRQRTNGTGIPDDEHAEQPTVTPRSELRDEKHPLPG